MQDQYGTGIQCDDPSPGFSDDDDVLQRVHDSESIRLSSSFAEVSNKDDQENQQHQKVFTEDIYLNFSFRPHLPKYPPLSSIFTK